MAQELTDTSDSCKGSPTEADLELVASRLKPADFEPFVRKAADGLYEAIMHSCEDYLRENVQWNIGSHIHMLERENQRMREELFEVDKALGCWSLGQAARLAAIKETQDRNRQIAANLHDAHREIARMALPID